jgi:hypothetical protein
VFALGTLLTGCGPEPAPGARAKGSAVSQDWYAPTVAQLNELNGQAGELFAKGNQDAAAALMKQGEALSHKLLEVPRPTLEATEAASDLDQLYGRMLLSNYRYGWARLQFQKNVVRWKYWLPRSAETERRLNMARDAIAECDRKIAE